jgi:NAD(P)H-flavin reductase
VARILYYNFGRQDGAAKSTSGVVHALPGGLFQMDISLGRDFAFVPGQYIFVHFGGKHHMLQSHPFTILSYEEEPHVASISCESSSLGRKSSRRSCSSEETSRGKVLTLLIRQHKGITKQLNRLSDGRPSIMLVEGPYGQGLPLQNYDNVGESVRARQG